MLRKTRSEETESNMPEQENATKTMSEQKQFIQKPPDQRWDKLLNLLIGALSLIVVALVISLIIRLNSTPVDPNIKQDAVESTHENNGQKTDETAQVKSTVIRVEVLNGTSVPRLASKASDFLRARGFDVVQAGNAQHSNFKKSVVQDRLGNIQNAIQVANALGISESGVIQQKNPQLYVEVTVIIGSDYKSLKFMSGN